MQDGCVSNQSGASPEGPGRGGSKEEKLKNSTNRIYTSLKRADLLFFFFKIDPEACFSSGALVADWRFFSASHLFCLRYLAPIWSLAAALGATFFFV